MIDKITVEPSMYKVSDGKHTIFVEKEESGTLKIFNNRKDTRNSEFWFIHSKPEVVKAIGQLLVRAAQIIGTEKILEK